MVDSENSDNKSGEHRLVAGAALKVAGLAARLLHYLTAHVGGGQVGVDALAAVARAVVPAVPVDVGNGEGTVRDQHLVTLNFSVPLAALPRGSQVSLVGVPVAHIGVFGAHPLAALPSDDQVDLDEVQACVSGDPVPNPDGSVFMFLLFSQVDIWNNVDLGIGRHKTKMTSFFHFAAVVD